MNIISELRQMDPGLKSGNIFIVYFYFAYPEIEDSSKSVSISASMHIYNAQTKGTQRKSIAKKEMAASPDQFIAFRAQ